MALSLSVLDLRTAGVFFGLKFLDLSPFFDFRNEAPILQPQNCALYKPERLGAILQKTASPYDFSIHFYRHSKWREISKTWIKFSNLF